MIIEYNSQQGDDDSDDESGNDGQPDQQDTANDSEEEMIEISLRPTSFNEYIGQEHLKNNIKLAIDAVKIITSKYFDTFFKNSIAPGLTIT